MLWSLLKMALFFLAVAALALGIALLMEFDGSVRVSLGATEFNLGPLQAAAAALLLLLAFWLLLVLGGLAAATIRFLNGDETAISRYFDRGREIRGYAAFGDAMIALASGEGREAMRIAGRSARLLRKPELTNLLSAQAAELADDAEKAEAAYRALLADPATRFVGVRGIMKQRLARGDVEMAMKFAEKALAIRPAHAETQDTLLRLQAEREDWAGARRTLAAKLSAGALPRDVHRRRNAVLALSEGMSRLEDGDEAGAEREFLEANRLSPDFAPAAAMAARGLVRQGRARAAARAVTRAWKAGPHPDLAAAFAAIEEGETPEQRIRRFGALAKTAPDHPETRMLLAELHVANGDFPAARRAMGDLAEADPTVRALTLMAAIERGEGSDDAVVRGWLARALSAPRGPQWICDACNSVQGAWGAVCRNCGGLDTLSWREAAADGEAPAPTDALPLIVGGPAEGAGPDGAAEEETADEGAAARDPVEDGEAGAGGAQAKGAE